MKNYYLNEDKTYTQCDVLKWATQYEDRKACRVAEDIIGDCRISTVWLGLDHNYDEKSKTPLVFETMVFDKHGNEVGCERYSSWDDAKNGHAKKVEELKMNEENKSEFLIEGDYIFFSSGRKHYANQGIVGIVKENGNIYVCTGYDDGINYDDENDDSQYLPREDRIELADHMISLWQEFKGKNK